MKKERYITIVQMVLYQCASARSKRLECLARGKRLIELYAHTPLLSNDALVVA